MIKVKLPKKTKTLMLPGHASCMNNQSLQISRRIWCMTVEHNSEKAWFGGLLIKSAQNADELVSEITGFTVVDNRASVGSFTKARILEILVNNFKLG